MANEDAKRDGNNVPVLLGITNDANLETRMLRVDPTTNRVLASASASSGFVTGTGASGQVSYWTGTSSQAGSNNLFWDITNSRLGIGTATPAYKLDIFTAGGDTNFLNIAGNNVPVTDGWFRITNSTSSNAVFSPVFWARGNDATTNSTLFLADTLGTKDIGTVPLMAFQARAGNSTVGTRPLFQWGNFTAPTMTMLANGSLGIGTITPSTALDVLGTITARGTGAAQISFNTTSRSAAITLDNSTGVLTLSDANDASGIAFGGGASLGSWTSSGLVLVPKITKYNNITTTGWGVPAIYGYARPAAGQVGAVTLSTYTVGAADGSFLVSANILVTTATLHSFTVTCTYTDEGNTSRTLTLQLSTIAGAFITAITNAQGTVPYEGVPLHIRAKASTSITIATTGTFTTVVYNGESSITQIA